MKKETLIALMFAAEDLGIGEAWEEPTPRVLANSFDDDEEDFDDDRERSTFTARDDYSGRGMNGRNTFAVVCGGWSQFCYVAARATAMLAADDKPTDEFVESLARLSSDSMGRDSIVIY